MISQWARKVKRRKPGIYLVRTRKHAGRTRENGYVGLSNNWKLRRNCHLGKCAHPNHTAKPWTDLDPRWHVLRLPWWLGWRWVLAPLEFIAIRVLLPRYNVKMNGGNPRQIPSFRAAHQRAQRDANRVGVGSRVIAWRPSFVQVIGAVFFVVGIVGALVSR